MTEQNVCAVPQEQVLGQFEELREAWGKDKHWVHFFIRPCCPAPLNDVAENMIQKLKADVDAADFTPEQKAELKQLADQRLEWYKRLSVRKGK